MYSNQLSGKKIGKCSSFWC